MHSDWTTFYVSTQGDEMMLERLKKSIFNNDIFQGISDKSSSAQQGQPDAVQQTEAYTKQDITVAALKGPTAIGMAQIMKNAKEGKAENN